MEFLGDYLVETSGKEARNEWGEYSYKIIFKVYHKGELLLSSENLEKEEFINCLKFVIPEQMYDSVVEYIQEGYFEECNATEMKELDDFENNMMDYSLYGYDEDII